MSDYNVKEVLEDGTELVRTCAWSPPGCHPVGCGLKLFVKEGKLVKVEGDEDHPITKGRLCPRCLALPEVVYNPDRIIYPMKRAKEDRGKDKWERISWDEALDIFADNYQKTIAEYGYTGTCLFVGTGRSACITATVASETVLRSPNQCYAFSGWSCYGPRNAVVTFVTGAGIPEMDYAASLPLRYDDPQYEIPKNILVWGKQPLVSNPDGLFGHAIIELMRRGSKVITIDPRMSWLATRSDLVLRLRPGTDAALALGMLNVVITEGIYDRDFVEKWCFGFDELAARVNEYPVAKVAEITGVPVEKIQKAARAMTEKPSCMTWGLAVDENTNGTQAGQAIMDLMAITGNLDIPGGTILGGSAGLSPANNQDTPVPGVPEDAMEQRVGAKKYPAVSSICNTVQPDEFLDCLETDEPYPVRFAWLQSSNLISPTCSVQPQRWQKALEKMDFVMATDLFMNPTIMSSADLFLPVATFPEINYVVSPHYGGNNMFVSAINKAIQVGEAKSDIEIDFTLLKRITPELKDVPVEALVMDFLNGLSASFSYGTITSWEDLHNKGTVQVSMGYKKYETGKLRPDGQPGFNTPTGRIELRSSLYEECGDDPLPYYFEPHMSPVSTPEYDFILTTGPRHYSLFHSEHRMVKTLRDLHREPIVEINPKDAKEHGVEENDQVRITNEYGEARFRARITPIVKQGTLSCDHGWWFPEESPEDQGEGSFGVYRSNVNTMCPHHDIGKLGFGAPLKNLMCNLEKC